LRLPHHRAAAKLPGRRDLARIDAPEAILPYLEGVQEDEFFSPASSIIAARMAFFARSASS